MAFSTPETLNCRGRILDISRPIVMGILNISPDSFYDGGKLKTDSDVLKHAEKILAEGGKIMDVGGMSSRPGADFISEEEERNRVIPIIKKIKKEFPEAIISVDTWRASVFQAAMDEGADILNDISGGQLDESLWPVIAGKNIPYILMHIQGTPENMQINPQYDDVLTEVMDYFIEKTDVLKSLNISDIILDPGFGFGKTLEHNYKLLSHLEAFKILSHPLLVGISRKSMIYKPLNTNPKNALNGTTALHLAALQQGAKILRVHDVAPAIETIQLWELMEAAKSD